MKNKNKKPKMVARVTASGTKSKELGLTKAVKTKTVETKKEYDRTPIGSTFTKTKTRLGGAKTTKTKNITDKRAARIAKRYQKFAPEFSRAINKPKAKFPDLSGDGKITKKDILIGRGVINKPKMLVKKRKDYV